MVQPVSLDLSRRGLYSHIAGYIVRAIVIKIYWIENTGCVGGLGCAKVLPRPRLGWPVRQVG